MHTGKPVVVDADTTPTTEVSALPDGTMQMVQSTVPVRVKSGSGWVPIDESLATDSNGGLAPKAADVPVEFGAGGSDVLARLQTKTGKWLDETSPFGILPTPVVSGPTATYPNVLPGVDLQLTATTQGMSEVLVIKSATAAANPKLHGVSFRVSGSALSSKAGGLATATLPDGSQALATSPSWWDSSNGSTADGPGGNASARPVSQTVGSSSVSLDAQAAATTAGVQYPVYVDPDWTGGLQAYTYVDAAYTTTSYWDGANATGQQRTGYIAASYSPDARNHKARSLWQVDTTGVEGKHILASTFSVTEDWSFNCTPSEVDLYWSGGISPSTTWNNQPGLIQLLSSATVAYGNNSGCPTHSVGFSATAGVQAAANLNATGLTLELKAANEASNGSWKRFTQAAQITINYNSIPNVPTSLQVASPPRACGTSSNPVYLNGNQPVNLTANVTDPDSGNIHATFAVSSVDSNGALSQTWSAPTASGAQGVQQVTVPAGKLGDGKYAWDVQANDGTDVSSYSAYCYFVAKTNSPPLPTINQLSTPDNVGAEMKVQFGSSPADLVVGFVYWWADTGVTSPSAVVPAGGPTIGAALPACNSTAGGLTFVCPDANGNSAVISVAPIDDTSTLWVASYDAAGNLSKAGPSSAAGLEVDTLPDPNVDFSSGHGWITNTLSSPIPGTLADANPGPGSGLTAPQSLTLSPGLSLTTTSSVLGGAASPVLSFPGYTQLNRYIKGSTEHASIGDTGVAAGYTLEGPLGQLYPLPAPGQAAPSGTSEVFSCTPANGDVRTSKTSTCDGLGVTGVPMGYVWNTAGDVPSGVPSSALYRCRFGANDSFDSVSPTCEGQVVDTLLGYLAELKPTHTSGQGIDTTKSFTVSAWLYPSSSMNPSKTYSAVAELGSANPGFVLGVATGGQGRFCVVQQAPALVSFCAVGPVLTQNSWTFETGIWDPVNQRVSLLLGTSLDPAATTYHALGSGDVSANGAITVGNSGISNAMFAQWNGYIDDPTVFPGIVDSNQLTNLYYQNPPQ